MFWNLGSIWLKKLVGKIFLKTVDYCRKNEKYYKGPLIKLYLYVSFVGMSDTSHENDLFQKGYINVFWFSRLHWLICPLYYKPQRNKNHGEDIIKFWGKNTIKNGTICIAQL